ncbi:MAG: hypothetical protein PSV23_13200 [Brevundimonas sp.]|uniref:hypothetical protein n=1 Tax=Brevundimonas sp. TaxID=1871086 RepID=UPI00248912C6|nr:hypothetical protein [Brevundimonas sp.]MDI1327741.1 hypothetical protein [Brevundimonas sp.]
MTDDIDRLIAAMQRDETGLAGMEDRVWVRIGERRDRTRTDQVRAAAIALAVAVGVANGAFMLLSPRPEPSEMRVFTVSTGLSPIASLDVRG